MGDPTSTHHWYLSWFKSKRCHKERFWDNSCVIVEQTERGTTRFPVTILRPLLPGSQTQRWWCQYHMSVSSHELNQCVLETVEYQTFAPTGTGSPQISRALPWSADRRRLRYVVSGHITLYHVYHLYLSLYKYIAFEELIYNVQSIHNKQKTTWNTCRLSELESTRRRADGRPRATCCVCVVCLCLCLTRVRARC